MKWLLKQTQYKQMQIPTHENYTNNMIRYRYVFIPEPLMAQFEWSFTPVTLHNISIQLHVNKA